MRAAVQVNIDHVLVLYIYSEFPLLAPAIHTATLTGKTIPSAKAQII